MTGWSRAVAVVGRSPSRTRDVRTDHVVSPSVSHHLLVNRYAGRDHRRRAGGLGLRGADDLRRLLGDDFTVERHAVEPRIDALPGTPYIADVVLRARRR